MGETVKDETVIEVLFNIVPRLFSDIVNMIEQWGDLTTMMVAEAVGRLAVFKENQRSQHRQSDGGGSEQLMLVTEALEQLMKGKGGSLGASSSEGGRGRGGGQGRGGGPGDRAQVITHKYRGSQ